MHSLKAKLLEELMEHVEKKQGMSLADLVAKKPALNEMERELPIEEEGMGGDEIPGKGVKVESIEILGKKNPAMDGPVTGEGEAEEEMSDEELKELLSQYL